MSPLDGIFVSSRAEGQPCIPRSGRSMDAAPTFGFATGASSGARTEGLALVPCTETDLTITAKCSCYVPIKPRHARGTALNVTTLNRSLCMPRCRHCGLYWRPPEGVSAMNAYCARCSTDRRAKAAEVFDIQRLVPGEIVGSHLLSRARRRH